MPPGAAVNLWLDEIALKHIFYTGSQCFQWNYAPVTHGATLLDSTTFTSQTHFTLLLVLPGITFQITAIPPFIAFCFIVLQRCCLFFFFYNLKARPSTSKMITIPITVILTSLRGPGTKPTLPPRCAYNSLHWNPCLRVCFQGNIG